MDETEKIKKALICILQILQNIHYEIEKNNEIKYSAVKYIEKTIEILDC